MNALAIATQNSDRLSAFLAKMSESSCVCLPDIPAFSEQLAQIREQNVELRPLASSTGVSAVLSQFNAGNLIAFGQPEGLSAAFPGLAKVGAWEMETVEVATVLQDLSLEGDGAAFVDTPGQTSHLVVDLMRWSEGAFAEIGFILAAEPLFCDELSLPALEEVAQEYGYQILRWDAEASIHGHYCEARFNSEMARLRKELTKVKLDLENLKVRYQAQIGDYQDALGQLEAATRVYEKLLSAPPDLLKALDIMP